MSQNLWVLKAQKVVTVWNYILSIDLSEYYLKNVNKILGILASGISQEN
ncbi:MAG: hypothetical protein V7K21_08115 [Nostoc sp.]